MTYKELVKEEQELLTDHYNKLRKQHKIKEENIDTNLMQRLLEAANKAAQDEMLDFYETLWEQFVVERTRRKNWEQLGNILETNTEGT